MTSSNAAPSLEGFVKSALHRSWWLLLLRGIAAVAFGVLTFVWPQISLLTLILVYGIYALADGILALIAAIRGGGMVPLVAGVGRGDQRPDRRHCLRLAGPDGSGPSLSDRILVDPARRARNRRRHPSAQRDRQ